MIMHQSGKQANFIRKVDVFVCMIILKNGISYKIYKIFTSTNIRKYTQTRGKLFFPEL